MTLLKIIYGSMAVFYLFCIILALSMGYSIFKMILLIVGLVYFGGKFIDKLEEG